MAFTETVVLQRTDDTSGKLIGIAPLTLQFVEQEDRRWTGECLELGTAAYADSFSEVSRQLKEAILLQVSEIQELGYVDAYLRDHNVYLTRPQRPARQWELIETGRE